MNAFYQSPLANARPYQVGIGSNSFGAHWHSELELLYVLTGMLRVWTEDCEYTVNPGFAIIISAATAHSLDSLSPDTTYLVVELGHALLGEGYSLFLERRFSTPLLCPDGDLPILAGIPDRIADCVRTKNHSPEYEWRLKSFLFAFSAKLADLPYEAITSDERSRRLLSLRRMQEVLFRVETEYAFPWRVSDAAQIAGFEEKSFCRAFHAVTGRTFHQYLNETRINAAKLLLSEDDIPIARIGESVGFPEPKTFSRVFHSIVGQTPTKYRHSQQQSKTV